MSKITANLNSMYEFDQLIRPSVPFSSSDCATYDPNILFSRTSRISKVADSILVPKNFAKVVEGFMFTVVDEENGENNGGGTNTFGFYLSVVFNSSAFPNGICDIPTNVGSARCGDSGDGYIDGFLLGPADAISVLTCTPPPVAYFGHDLIISTRLTEEYPFYPGQNFGDTVSMRTINVSSAATDVFDEPALIIISADGKAAEMVANAYMKVGVSDEAISIKGVSVSTVNLWDRSNGKTWEESKPDILATISRVTAAQAGAEDSYNAYKTLIWPARFYFADDDTKAADELDPPLSSRYSEAVTDEVTEYGDTFEVLKASIISQRGQLGSIFLKEIKVNLTMEGFYDDWQYILDQKNNNSFVAGTRDATYGLAQDGGLMTNATSAVLIGVIHSNTIDAAYSSVGVDLYSLTIEDYVQITWFLSKDLVGSSDRYLKDYGDEYSSVFYAVDFEQRGGCGMNSFCVEFNGSFVSENEVYVFPEERIYSVAETAVGSSANTTLQCSLLVFAR